MKPSIKTFTILSASAAAVATGNNAAAGIHKSRMGTDITVDGDSTNSNSYGQIVRDPTYRDRESFKIATEGDLANLLCRTESNMCGPPPNLIPAAAYVTENELDYMWQPEFYQTVGVPNVQLKVSHAKVEVLQSELKPVMLKGTMLINHSNVAGTFKTEIYDEVTETRETSWSNTLGFSFEQSFNYIFKFLGSGGGGETTFGFSTEWSKSESVSQSTTLGSSSGVEVYLEPGDGVYVELLAERGTAKIQTLYDIALVGNFTYVAEERVGYVENNNNKIGNFHPFKASIANQLAKDGMPSSLSVVEVNEVGYYARDQIRMTSLSSNKYLTNFEKVLTATN